MANRRNQNQNVKSFPGTKRFDSSKLKFKPKNPSNYKLSPANKNHYIKMAHEIKPLLTSSRIVALSKRNWLTLKRYKDVASTFVEDVWKNHCEERNLTYEENSYAIAKTLLTKSDEITPTYIKTLMENLQGEFDVQDKFPQMPSEFLIQQLIRQPKKTLAEMQFNGMGKHGRPCYVVRQLLECTVNERKYLLINDLKIYQNSPVIASPLILLRGGYKDGACLIGRIDETSTYDPNQLDYYKQFYTGSTNLKTLKLPLYPDYLISKIDETHPNTPNNTSIKFPPEVSQERHVHYRTDDYSTLDALSTMARTVAFHTSPTDPKKFNAKEIFLRDYFTSDTSKNNTNYYEDIQNYYDEETKKANFILDEIIDKGKGILSLSHIINYINKTFKTSYVIDENFIKFFDQLRMFKPTKKVVYVNPKSQKPLSPQAMQIPTSPNSNLANKVRRAQNNGEYVDPDYVRSHPEVLKHL